LNYQWRFNGAAVSGATNSALALTSAQGTNGGSYTVVVTNNFGSITSQVATLTVNIPPAITTQTQNLTATQGQNASLSVVASGTAPFTYQWSVNGALLSGATNATLVLTDVQTTGAGIVTNNAVTITTNTSTPTFGFIDPVASTFTDCFNVSNNLHGLMYADQDENWGPTLFYSTRQPASGADEFDTISTIPSTVGEVTDRFALSSTNYDALTLSAPDVGYGAVNFYYVRHDDSGDSTFGVIKAAGASSSADLWPLTGSGYNSLAFAAANVGYGANMFYSLGQDDTGLSIFGSINPTPGGIETGLYSVGTKFDAMVFVPSAVSTWGTGIFAYLRHNSTGSIVGTIDPVTQTVTDRISLGSNFFNALTFTATDVGYGPNLFYYLRPAVSTMTTNTVTSYTGSYTVVVSNNAGSVTSQVATLTVTMPVVTLSPAVSGATTTHGFSFQCSVPLGLTYIIMASTDFRTWTPIATNIATSASAVFTDTAAAGYHNRFYRAMVQ
jgi:hypothetical protein